MREESDEIIVSEYKNNYFNKVLNCINEFGYVPCYDNLCPIDLAILQDDIFERENKVYIVDNNHFAKVKTGSVERIFSDREFKLKQVKIIAGTIRTKEGIWIIDVYGREALSKILEFIREFSKGPVNLKMIKVNLVSESIDIIY